MTDAKQTQIRSEIARMREVAASWRRPGMEQVEGPNDLKIYGGTIADDIDRWADLLASVIEPGEPLVDEHGGRADYTVTFGGDAISKDMVFLMAALNRGPVGVVRHAVSCIASQLGADTENPKPSKDITDLTFLADNLAIDHDTPFEDFKVLAHERQDLSNRLRRVLRRVVTGTGRLEERTERVMQEWRWGNLTALGVANNLVREGFASEHATSVANALPRDIPSVDQLFDWLSEKYVQRADERQKQMGLQYTTAETRDLAECLHAMLVRRQNRRG